MISISARISRRKETTKKLTHYRIYSKKPAWGALGTMAAFAGSYQFLQNAHILVDLMLAIFRLAMIHTSSTFLFASTLILTSALTLSLSCHSSRIFLAALRASIWYIPWRYNLSRRRFLPAAITPALITNHTISFPLCNLKCHINQPPNQLQLQIMQIMSQKLPYNILL